MPPDARAPRFGRGATEPACDAFATPTTPMSQPPSSPLPAPARPSASPSLLRPGGDDGDSLLIDAKTRRLLSATRVKVAFSLVVVTLLLGLGALSFVLVSRIFDNLTPAIAHDLAWKAERGAAELSYTTELAVALGEGDKVKAAAKTYLEDKDVSALVVLDAEQRVLFSHPPSSTVDPRSWFVGPRDVPHETEQSFAAWTVVDIEGAEIGRVALAVSKRRLESGAELRSNILVAVLIGCLVAFGVALVFVSFYVGPLLNLTRQAFYDLEQRTREAIEGSRLKSEFLANMSHEIRTPMNGVIGMAELMQKTPLSAKQRRYARTITTSASALLTIINDILDFSKIEAGKLSVRPVESDVRRLAEEVAQLLAPQGSSKGVEVMCVIAPDVPREVMVDHDRLRQVLNNIMGNAVKFTNSGNVVLRLAVQGRDAEAGTCTLAFSISDTGIGIAKEDQAKVFELFSQVDGSVTRVRGGTGLGLTISRHLVRLMGGELELESELGKGSTFRFAVTAKVLGEGSHAPAGKLPRTLIVDDNDVNRTVLEELLQLWGVPTESARSGEEALELIELAANKGEAFELALVDHQMHGMQGPELARRIRELSGEESPRLVLVSSLSETMTVDDVFDDSLTKPVLQDDLRRVVQGGSTASEHDEVIGTIRFLGRPRILVAEDNPINREVMREILEELEIECDMAENGAAVLDALDRREYPLILMDCQMPVLDGYEAARRIRRRTDSRADIPIIAVTAHAVMGEREKALAAGMTDYVTKPVTITRLAKAMARYLQTETVRESRASVHTLEAATAEAAAELLAEDPEPAPAPASAPAQSGALDPGTKRSKVVVGLFLKMVPDQIEELASAVTAEDPVKVKALAHKLKGSCLAIGARRMGSLCAALEPNPGESQELVVALREEHELVRAALHADA
jgi:signal transduction histidine kinase/CheY-like chemotaxis protein/HPt (histidine-containing phosphotransfer) domain-containing protein